MERENNRNIEIFIDNMPDDYGFGRDDAKYMSTYTGADKPPFVYNELVQGIVKLYYPYIQMSTNREDKRALCYGYGSMEALSNTNVVLKSYQENYYCFKISQALHYDKVVTGDTSVVFRNLADYFVGYKGNNQKYHIVVLYPHDTEYHRIDPDDRFSGLSSFAYYTIRGAYFLAHAGVLVSLVPKRYGDEVVQNAHLVHETGAELDVSYEGDYAIIKITK